MAESLKKVEKIVTSFHIRKLEEGVCPWKCPWAKGRGLPISGQTGKEYKGLFNILTLMAAHGGGEYYTPHQIQKMGGRIKKGERGSRIIYYNWVEKKKVDPETGEETIERFPVMRYYVVFHVSQIEGIESKVLKESLDPHACIEQADRIINNYIKKSNLEVEEGFKCCYSPTGHKLTMVSKIYFNKLEEYYSTLFHELVHSTMKEVDRGTRAATFGSGPYAYEELVAELGSSMLCWICGFFPTIQDNSAAYIKGWLKALQDNPKWLLKAARDAQKAVEYILSYDPEMRKKWVSNSTAEQEA